MKKFDSAYYGVIPTPLRHHDKLKSTHKLIYAEITACLNENGVCTRSNHYFSKVLHMSKGTISNYMKDLRQHGFINVTIENEEGTMKFLNRYITLTPTSTNVGVESDSQNPHTSTDVGVVENNSLENAQTPASTNGTLLHSNNNIHTIHTNQQAMDTPLNKNINERQKDALTKMVTGFYKEQRTKHPLMIEKNWEKNVSIINGSINTLFELIKLDSFEYEVVRDVIKWAVDDKFWGQHLLSLRTLRSKSDNGFTKFQNLHHKYKNK